MRKHRKHREDSGFNVWRSYSDMMAGLLLLFVLIMCVTLFQAQKSYDDSLKERDERLALQQQYTQEIENQQNTVDQQADQLKTQDELLAEQRAQLEALAAQLEEQKATLDAQAAQLDEQAAQLDDQAAQLNDQSALLNQQQTALDEKTAELASQQAKIDNIIGVKADVIEALRVEFANNNLSVDIDSQSGAMTLDSSVMFDYNESELTKEGRRVLKEVLPIYCQVLLQDQYVDYLAEIIIDGYTDTTGDYSYNLELSQKRSLAVAQYLLALQDNFLDSSQQELLQDRLTVNGHSMSNPILDENGEVDMDASRRVEVKFRLKDEEMIEELTKIMSGSDTESTQETENTSETEAQ
ncbi:MAG: OmpA family protein [Eubacteriales bacterium]|nr:OmpA family protein [Eubacteriales bacterium]